VNSLLSPFVLSRLRLFLTLLFAFPMGGVLPAPAVVIAGQADAISGSEWESPQFGIVIAWNDEWEPQEASPAVSDEEGGVDSVALTGAHGNFRGTVLDMRDDTMETYRDYLLAQAEDLPDYALVEAGENEDAAYFAYTAEDETQDDRQYTSIVEVFMLDDDLLAVSEAIGWSEALPDLFADVQENIDFDGQTPFGYYNTEETIPEAAAVDDGGDSALPGLIDETSYEGPTHGGEVTWTDDWSVDFVNSGSDEDGDRLWLSSDSATLLIDFVTSDGSLEDHLDDLFDQLGDFEEFEDLEVIEQDSDDDLAWLAVSAVNDDTLAIWLYEASWYDEDEEVLQLVEITAWADDLEASFEDVQDDIEIDGNEPFVYFPSEALIDALGFELVDDEDEDAPEGDDDGAGEDEDRNGGGNDEDEVASLPGVVAEDEYESPQFDYGVTWSDDWTPSTGFTYSNREGKQDCLRLDNGESFVQITATHIANESPQSFMARPVSFRANAEATVVLDQVRQYEEDGRLYLRYHWESTDGTINDVYVEMWVFEENPTIVMQAEIFAPPDDLVDVFDDAMDEIELDGEPLFRGSPED